MNASLLALLSAAAYGAGDFCGGLASRRAPTLAVVFVSQFAGLITLLFALSLLPPAIVTGRDLVWGGIAGLAGGAGVALLYRALAIGTMAVVAPTTAVCAVIVPVGAGVLLGERPTALQLAGIALALAAIVLVGQEPPRQGGPAARSTPRGLGLALASGVAIGIFFLALARTSAAAGLWPLVSARGVSGLLFGTTALVRGAGHLRMDRRALAMTIGGGILDMLANALYILATRGGALSVIITLSSLYPASTVILARVILRERLGTAQIVGIGVALAAIVLIVQ